MCAPALLKVHDEEFREKVIECGRPALVFFSASWSQPCKLMEERVQGLIAEYEERMSSFLVDVDESPKTAAAFEIKSVPTLTMQHGARVMERFVSCKTPEELSEFISKTVSDIEEVMRSEAAEKD